MDTHITIDLDALLLSHRQETETTRYKGGKQTGMAHQLVRRLVQDQGFIPRPYEGLYKGHPNKDDVRFIRERDAVIEEFRDLYRGAELFSYSKENADATQTLIAQRENICTDATHIWTLAGTVAGSGLLGYAIGNAVLEPTMGGGLGWAVGTWAGLLFSLPTAYYFTLPLKEKRILRIEEELVKYATFLRDDDAIKAALSR